MILKRKIYEKLLAWKKECNGSKALLIEGARRIGKAIFDQIPGLLSQHEKRVVFKDIQQGSFADQYEDTFSGFLISNNSKLKYKLFPIEVKSSKNYTTTSLLRFKEKFKQRIGECYIIHPKNLDLKDDVLCIPPYMAICL